MDFFDLAALADAVFDLAGDFLFDLFSVGAGVDRDDRGSAYRNHRIVALGHCPVSEPPQARVATSAVHATGRL